MGNMWIFTVFNVIFIFCVSFLPVFLDTGLQVWNGININSTDFARTAVWDGVGADGPASAAFTRGIDDSSMVNFPNAEDGGSLQGRGALPEEECINTERNKLKFFCADGTTEITWCQFCDDKSDCPKFEGGEGGDDEVFGDEGSGFGEEDEGSGCSPPDLPAPPSKNYVEITLSSSLTFVLSLETVVSLALLQLPAVCLALYGILCAFQQPRVLDKITDSLLALLLIFIPFCFVEIFTLMEVEFAHKGLQFLMSQLKSICQAVMDLVCGGCSDQAVARLDLLKFLPSKDPTGRDRALSVEAAKLVCGSCIQLAFQAVLLGGYTSTEQFQVSQGLSVLSSALVITKTAAVILLFRREAPAAAMETSDLKTKVVQLAKKQLAVLWQLMVALPLILSSLVFQTGTLVLAILVTEWYSAIYIVAALLLNLTISLLLPFSMVKTSEKKLNLTYKFSKMDPAREAGKVVERRILRGLFTSWANLFIVLRPVEHMSYHKVTHMCLLQPLRFLLNIITLIVLVVLTWASAKQTYIDRNGVGLIIAYVVVFGAGVLNQLEMICYFYYGESACLSKAPREAPIELKDIERGSDNPAEVPDEVSPLKDDGKSDEENEPLLEPKSPEPDVKPNDEEVESEKEEVKQDNAEGINETENKEEDVKLLAEEKVEVEEKAEEAKEAEEEAVTEEEDSGASSADESCLQIPDGPPLLTSASDTTGMTNKHLLAPRLRTQVSVKSLDDSCFINDEDIDVIAAGQGYAAKEEVKKTITDIQENNGGKVDKEKFVGTMMDLFPRYNVEENKKKLEKLFDRLDKHDEGLISFRQFMLVGVAFSSASLEAKLISIFKLIDQDDDDELTYPEFEETVKDILVLKEERKMSNANIESTFSQNTFRDMGQDKDGKVNLRSFVEACTRQKFIIINYIENFKDDFHKK